MNFQNFDITKDDNFAIFFIFLKTEEQLHKVKPLTFGDLRKSIAAVAMDVAGSKFYLGLSCHLLEICLDHF